MCYWKSSLGREVACRLRHRNWSQLPSAGAKFLCTSDPLRSQFLALGLVLVILQTCHTPRDDKQMSVRYPTCKGVSVQQIK